MEIKCFAVSFLIDANFIVRLFAKNESSFMLVKLEMMHDLLVGMVQNPTSELKQKLKCAFEAT